MDRMPYNDNNFKKDAFDALRWIVFSNDEILLNQYLNHNKYSENNDAENLRDNKLESR